MENVQYRSSGGYFSQKVSNSIDGVVKLFKGNVEKGNNYEKVTRCFIRSCILRHG